MSELNDIVVLAKQGIEHSILNDDKNAKELFLAILIKAELCQLSQTDVQEKKARTNNKINKETKYDMMVVAYCFSHYEHDMFYPDLTQSEALKEAAKVLGVKKTTLRNTRDWFDGHNSDANRKGWKDKPMPLAIQLFLDVCAETSTEEMIAGARRILGQET